MLAVFLMNDILNLIGLVFNLIGAFVLLKGTHGLESYPGAFLVEPEIYSEIAKRNDNRIKAQKLGCWLLVLGFILQLAAIPLVTKLFTKMYMHLIY